MKTLINIPKINMIGGVSQIYRVLELNDSSNIDYFNIMEEKETSKLKKFKRLILKYIKYFFKIRKYDNIILNPSFIQNAFYRDSLYCILARFLNKKIIIFWHGWEGSFENKIHQSWLKKKLFLFTYAHADITLVLGKIFEQKLQDLGSTKTKYVSMTSIADDTDIENFNIKQKFDIQVKKNNIDFLFLSRIEKEKGIYIAIDAINEVNKIKKNLCILHIAGTGGELNNVKEYVSKNNIQNIIFHGYVSGKDKFNLLENTDIFFFPTYFGEGLPNSILEAMLYAQPIISRVNAGIPDHIINEKNGFLTESIDYIDFIPYINYFIDNKEKISEIGLYNYNQAKKSYTAKKVKEKYLAVVKSLIDE